MVRGSGWAAGARGAGGSPLRLLRQSATPIAALAVALAAACSPDSTAERGEVVLSVGYAAAEETGVGAGIDQLIDQLTREGLARTGPDGRVEPMLADSWEVDRSGTTITVDLRRDVSFHDGSPMSAEDVKASLDRVLGNPIRIARNPALGDIESVDTDGRYRVVIHLARPAAQLVLFGLGARVEKDGSGTGPFFVDSGDDDETTTLRANPHYHQGRSEIDTVRIKTYPTLRTAWAAMLRSEIDFLFNVPIEDREFVEADSSVRVFSRDTPYAYALLFNTRQPPFDDRRLRVALSHAVDRDAIIDRTFRGHGSVASGIWPSHWVYGGLERIYEHDPLKADRQLTEIGLRRPVPTDRDSTRGLASRLRFELLVGIDQARLEPIALLVQRQLRQIGVEMTIDARPFAEVQIQLGGNSWDAVLLPFNTARNLGRLHLYWHSSQQLATSGFTGTDDALEALRSSVTESDMKESAIEFQRMLFEGAPAVFLTNVAETRAVSRRFVVPDAPGRDVMETLWQWRVADPTSPN